MHTNANSPCRPHGSTPLSEALSRAFEKLFGASFKKVFKALFKSTLEEVLFDPALERDRRWFNTHPYHGRLRRRVTSWELPQSLRGRGIVWVEVLLGGDHYDKKFFDRAFDVVASDFDVIAEGVDTALEHARPILRCGAEVVEQVKSTAEDRQEFAQFPGLVASQHERVALPVELDWARSFLGFQPQKGLVSVTMHSPTIRSRELLLETFN